MLDDDQQARAERLGKAMRFGAMLWASGDDTARLALAPKKRVLELTLTRETEALFGEVAHARFGALASALDATTKIKIKR